MSGFSKNHRFKVGDEVYLVQGRGEQQRKSTLYIVAVGRKWAQLSCNPKDTPHRSNTRFDMGEREPNGSIAIESCGLGTTDYIYNGKAHYKAVQQRAISWSELRSVVSERYTAPGHLTTEDIHKMVNRIRHGGLIARKQLR